MTVILLVLLPTLACELGASSGDAVQPAVDAEFSRAIAKVQYARARDAKSQEKLERDGEEMLARFTTAEQHALIHYWLCHAHAQSGVVRPDMIVEHGTAALRGLHEESLRMRAYVYVGDAQQIANRKDFPLGRELAAKSYMKGLSELLHAHDLPDVAPPLPPNPVPFPTRDDPSFKETDHAYSEYIAEREKARHTRELVMHRDVLERQIVELYRRLPVATGELRSLGDSDGLPASLVASLTDRAADGLRLVARGHSETGPAKGIGIEAGSKPGLALRPLLALNILVIVVLIAFCVVRARGTAGRKE